MDQPGLEPRTSRLRGCRQPREKEVSNGFKPKLKPLGVNIKDYDRIIVGTPTWWYKMAPAVLSFLSENDFTGKVLVPYMTTAGWPGSVIKDMIELARKNGAKVEDAHEFKFSSDERHNRGTRMMNSLRRWNRSSRKRPSAMAFSRFSFVAARRRMSKRRSFMEPTGLLHFSCRARSRSICVL